MYDKLTDKTRQVISYARQEAERLGHSHIETGHLLIGLLREGTGMAATFLHKAGVDTEALRARAEEGLGPREEVAAGGKQLPFTAAAKRAFEHAAEEAKRLNLNYIGTEHVLMGLLQAGDDAAAKALETCGVTLERVREVIADLLADEPQPDKQAAARVQARSDQMKTPADGRTAGPLIQAFRTVLAHYHDQETDALARNDEAGAAEWRDLYDRTMKAFRALCEGQS